MAGRMKQLAMPEAGKKKGMEEEEMFAVEDSEIEGELSDEMPEASPKAGKSSMELSKFTDEELMEEAKKRGFQMMAENPEEMGEGAMEFEIEEAPEEEMA